jgi:hypothetical protein
MWRADEQQPTCGVECKCASEVRTRIFRRMPHNVRERSAVRSASPHGHGGRINAQVRIDAPGDGDVPIAAACDSRPKPERHELRGGLEPGDLVDGWRASNARHR